MRKGIITIFLFMALFSLALGCCWAETIEFSIENSPYYVRQDLVIKEGSILTVEPGVIIEIAKDAGIIVEGRIDICGYPKGGEIIFKAKGPHKNYHKGFWQGIVIKSKGKNLINYAIIQHSKTGIELIKGASANITNNFITQNKTGIKAERIKELSVARNSFLGNFTDIELMDTIGLIEKNFFQGSLTCLKLKESYPGVTGNIFKQVHKNIIECDNEKDFFASGNWWGASDRERIESLILRQGKGGVAFEPYLEKQPDLSEAGVDLKEDCASCQEK